MLITMREYLEKTKFEKKNKEGLEKLCGVFSEYAIGGRSIDEIMKIEKEAYNEAREKAAVERYLKSYDISGEKF